MSTKEIGRLELIQRIEGNTLSQREAAAELKISERQMKRLMRRYREKGAEGLVSKQRGQPSHNRLPEALKIKTRSLVTRDYADFGPTFAAEKLAERDGVYVSRETLRKWMIEWEFWTPKRAKKSRVHQQRPRRPCFGELVQIDGSPHAWFEDRGEKCCLIVFIDDATSKIGAMLFVPVECTQAYVSCLKHYIKKYGRPIAVYSDKHSIFRNNHKNNGESGNIETQLGRIFRTLGIQIICANTPQAKGRVERANQTLQDRLVKELRLRKIKTIEEGNRYLEEFRRAHNRRFADAPACEVDQHRKTLPSNQELSFILCEHSTRKLSKNLELSYKGNIYQIVTKGYQIGYGMKNAKVIVAEDAQGKITIWYKGKKLAYRRFKKKMLLAEIIDSKELNPKVKAMVRKSQNKPSIDHPWRITAISKKQRKKWKVEEMRKAREACG